jgi:hypothetical protein
LNYYSNSNGLLYLNYKYYSLNYSSITTNPKPLLLTGANNLPSKKTSHYSISTTIITIYHYSKLTIIISNIIITSHSAFNHSYLLTKTTINPSNFFAAATATTIKKDSNSIIIKILYSISISHFLESNPLYHFLENLVFLNPNPSPILSLQKKKKKNFPPFK